MNQSLSFTSTGAWRQAHPGACAGFLALGGVENPPAHPQLEEQKRKLQDEIRSRYAAEQDIESLPVIQAYTAYYKRFKKTYHVLLQLQSIAFKGRSFPTAAGLVEAMFMAELENGLLTAGHDLNSLTLPVVLDSAIGSERYTLLRGVEQELKAGDMYMRAGDGVISSIIYGPDQRTQIAPDTRDVLFTVYAPAPIAPQLVNDHLERILEFVRLISPQLQVLALEILS